jgi:hypothetical protein
VSVSVTTSEPQPLAFQADLFGGAFVLTLTVVLGSGPGWTS